MTSALKNHVTRIREVDADVGTIDLFLHNQRLIFDESLRFAFTEMLIVDVPFDPNRCGVRGYLVKSQYEAPIFHILLSLKTAR